MQREAYTGMVFQCLNEGGVGVMICFLENFGEVINRLVIVDGEAQIYS
jgi:hypothetical protein